MAEDVYMDVPAVSAFSNTFSQIADVLKAVDTGLNIAITTLKTTAFVGMVGGLALAAYLEQIEPVVKRLANTCQELEGAIKSAVQAYVTGDTDGSRLFVG
jgi:hypothetical protein